MQLKFAKFHPAQLACGANMNSALLRHHQVSQEHVLRRLPVAKSLDAMSLFRSNAAHSYAHDADYAGTQGMRERSFGCAVGEFRCWLSWTFFLALLGSGNGSSECVTDILSPLAARSP